MHASSRDAGSLPGEKIALFQMDRAGGGAAETADRGKKRVAMQYSPNCAIPYVSMVDAGTVELVRGTGVEVVSSAELIQTVRSALDGRGTRIAPGSGPPRGPGARGRRSTMIRERDPERGIRCARSKSSNSCAKDLPSAGLFTDHGPIVGVNANASNPHYEPTEEVHAPIHGGDFVLLDMWAKLDQPGSVYYDITWTGVLRRTPPERCGRYSQIVTRRARCGHRAREEGHGRAASQFAASKWTTRRAA